MLNKYLKQLIISFYILPFSFCVVKAQDIDSIVYPSDIIPELKYWKIHLPVDANGNDNSNIINVHERNRNSYQVKKLIDFDYKPYFYVERNEVVFKAPCAGATTKNSKFPRSELRQLVGGGSNYWSVYKYQKLELLLRVTHTPIERPEVCMTQIHGPNDEPLRFQFHATKGLNIVWNEYNTEFFGDRVTYKLGQALKVKVEVDKGKINFFVTNLETNESYSKTWISSDTFAYFKVGCYTQSSIFLNQIKKEYRNEPADAYGEVRVKSIHLIENY
ncbi:MAG: polysaccharide lyase family 7 protein [Bacteroidales bacterium]|nr:polysaccharide lyase family 7 protein [Bacteroidales bacterium]